MLPRQSVLQTKQWIIVKNHLEGLFQKVHSRLAVPADSGIQGSLKSIQVLKTVCGDHRVTSMMWMRINHDWCSNVPMFRWWKYYPIFTRKHPAYSVYAGQCEWFVQRCICMSTPRNNTLQIIFEQTVVILCLLTPTRSVRKHFTWGALQWHISGCDLKCLTYCGCSVYYNEVYDSWDADLYKIYYFCSIDSFQR